ncbi:Hypothetical_protein [Hexamita inflata]|uniref:Hypothetical_protein n=1 Tax=Hexamita inflata TaxID=28002 RepID=A0AA86Q5J3_9EUKA|nr:Hypothetical protein HINF_LOCUS33894 [Hexamita inflata]
MCFFFLFICQIILLIQQVFSFYLLYLHYPYSSDYVLVSHVIFSVLAALRRIIFSEWIELFGINVDVNDVLNIAYFIRNFISVQIILASFLARDAEISSFSARCASPGFFFFGFAFLKTGCTLSFD